MWTQRLTVLLAALAGLLVILAAPVLSAERVALVVGNSAYSETTALRNPVNDATAMAAALRRLGFEVIEGMDLDREGFFDKIDAFDEAVRTATMALFFYAGHGLQVGGRNYLGPVDMKLEKRQDLRRRAIELAAVLEVMRSETNLVILDACRNNPLAGDLERSLRLDRNMLASRGLARVKSTGEMLIAYATAPGNVAADGDGDHSPYTEALLAHIEKPGLSVNDLFTQVTNSVLARTDSKQTPWTNSSLSKVVSLVPSVSPEPPVVVIPPSPSDRLSAEHLAAERVFWESVKDSTNAADLQAYLDQYPGGTYEVLARNRLQGGAAPVVPEETAKSMEATLGLGIPERRLIQLGLAAEGFDPGDADGLFGGKTRGAIGGWQSSRGEEATEHLDVESAKLLMSSGRKRQAQEQEAARGRRAMEPGRRFRDCDACPELVVVPLGSFMMGSPAGEEKRDDDEGPQHRVTIAEPFAVGVHEVTRGEFARFVRETNRSTGNSCRVWDSNEGTWVKRSGLNWRNPGFEQTDGHPVVCVNWDDAQSYVGWLSRETGEGYRLLSESEWEYVARAGTTGPFHTGATISPAQANYDGDYTYGSGRKGVYRERTVSVGSFSPNAFGLHDVHGNALEWVQDCWNKKYDGAPRDGGAWERGDCSRRVARGGSWFNGPRFLRSADRVRITTGTATTTLVSALPGRLLPESLPLYLWGSRGQSPLAEMLSF